MPFDHRSAPSGDPVYRVDAVTDAVLAEIMGAAAHAAALTRPARAPNPLGAIFVIWLVGAGRVCLTVLTGRWRLCQDEWRVDDGDGFRRTTSPLAAAWDEAMLTSRDIHRAVGKRVMIAPALLFLETSPSADIARVADRSAVAALWELEGLAARLADAAAADPQLCPLTADEAMAEMCALHDAGAPSTGPPT